jgi:hypothetical protein
MSLGPVYENELSSSFLKKKKIGWEKLEW